MKRTIKYIQFLTNSNKNIVAIKDKEVKGITTDNVDDIEHFLTKYADTHNLYYNANTANKNAPNDKVKKIDIESINAIWIDLDPEKGKDLQEERERLNKVAYKLNYFTDLPPSYIIDSGNGIQAIWLLKEALPYNQYKDVEALMRGLNATYNGDNTHNIDRLLRLPYTTNFPNEAKKKLGRTEKQSKVLYATQNHYSWAQLKTLAEPIDAPTYDKVDHSADFIFPPEEFPEELKEKWKNLLKEDHKLSALSKKEINFPSRSEYDFAVIQRLKMHNWNIQEVATLLYHFPHGKNKELSTREITRAFSRSTPNNQNLSLSADYINNINNQKNPIIEIKKQEAEAKKPKRKYKSPGQLTWKKSAKPLFKGLLDDNTISAMYGQSNVGKSFAAMDMAGHIAMGRDWGTFKLKGGKAAVLSVAAEAGGTYGKRMSALKKRFNLKEDVSLKQWPFAVYDDPIDLFEVNKDGICEGVIELAAQCEFIKEDTGYPVKLIILDTFSAIIGGGNENSPDDMGLVIKHIEQLRVRTGAHIMIVHHSGKDQSAGLRGHSKLIGAIDTSLELKLSLVAGKKKRELCPKKQRDNDTELAIEFNLNVIRLGEDEDGDPVTSCNIILEGDSEFESVIESEFEKMNMDQYLIYLSVLFSTISHSGVVIGGRPSQNRFSMFYYNYLLGKEFGEKGEVVEWLKKLLAENNDNLRQSTAHIAVCASPVLLDSYRARWTHFKREQHKISTQVGLEKSEENQYVIENSTLQHTISTNNMCG